jgi:hypothetical protein
MWENWVIDASMPTPDDNIVTFVPIEDDETLVLGMNFIGNKCPGNLVGVVHLNGQEAVEQWIKDHPDWHKQFKKAE